MRSLEENIALLLCHDQALTIQKVDGGFILAMSDMAEGDDESLIFVPETVLVSKYELTQAIDVFYEHQQMHRVRGFHA